MALYEMEDAKERVILVGVQENDAEPEEESWMSWQNWHARPVQR